ncbi:hypothetical protein WNY37_00655 [Henriciella sp. AS95]|uniref:hypothetical protein n=1 Tax=Henriciella sp. AS95 TaxID=3135782 RepID=UPI00317220BC
MSPIRSVLIGLASMLMSMSFSHAQTPELLGDAPASFGPRHFPLAVDTGAYKPRDGFKDGHLVIYDYTHGNDEAAALFAQYNQLVTLNGERFETAPQLYEYASNLPTGTYDADFVRRIDGETVRDTISLTEARSNAGCDAPQLANEGLVQGLLYCGDFFRIVTREQLLSCASTGIVTKFLRTKSSTPCGLVGTRVALTLGHVTCRTDMPSALVMGFAQDPRGDSDYLLHIRSDTGETAMGAAEAAAKCDELFGGSLDPLVILGHAIMADSAHFYYLGNLRVADDSPDVEWLDRKLKPGVMYMQTDTVLFAESASGFEMDPAARAIIFSN